MPFLKFIKYYLLWVSFFILARLIFVLYHFDSSQMIGFQTLIGCFVNGLRLDLSAAGYFSALPFLLFSLGSLTPRLRFWDSLAQGFTVLLLVLSAGLIAADLELFKNWGYRIDDTFLKYLLTPTEAAATVSSYPVLTLVLIFAVFVSPCIYAFSIFIFKKRGAMPHVLANSSVGNDSKGGGIGTRFLYAFIGILLTTSLIIPIRGGFQLAPVNQSAVYFSDKAFANYAAVNPIWNFFVSVFEKTSDDYNPYAYFAENELVRITEPLLKNSPKTRLLLRRDSVLPNILIITYESLTAKVIEKLGGEKGITPCFDSLTREGVLFTNIYATGDRTDRGVVGVLSAYPAIPRANIMEVPRKSAQLPVLTQILSTGLYRKERGLNFETGFYAGCELAFANMKSYLLQGSFTKLIGKPDFSEKVLSSKWGAFDHDVYERLLQDIPQFRQPFFINLLTQSSHEPFEIPEGWGKKGLPSTDDLDEKFRRAHFYSDQALGAFIRAAQKQAWWQNTLVVVIADHSSHHLEPHDDLFWKFRIPMLWLGGALAVRDTVVPVIGSQTDLAATVLAQLNIDHTVFKFSRNLLALDYQPFAYYAFHHGFGFVQPHGRYVFDTEGSFFIQKEGAIDSLDLKKGKALLQLTYQDYLKK
jgi:phosphoglycerol transferase MdoB-like AlkP superfamily enzyme